MVQLHTLIARYRCVAHGQVGLAVVLVEIVEVKGVVQQQDSPTIRKVRRCAAERVGGVGVRVELARLAADVSDDELRAAASAVAGSGSAVSAEAEARARFAAALAVVAGRRGLVLPPASPDDDDVIDPYGRSTATYERSADEMAPGLAAVERIVRVALS